MLHATESLPLHQVVILRRLRKHPLTEFELAREVAAHSGYSEEQAVELMAGWLERLRTEGFIWSGALTNADGQTIMAAALTRRGKELVG